MQKVNQRSKLKVDRLLKKRAGQSSLGFWPFSKWYDGKTDLEVGQDYIQRFFDSSSNTNRKIDYPTYIATLVANSNQASVEAKISGLGLGIKLADMADGDVTNAADTLAGLSNGLVPANVVDFRQALIGQAAATPFTDSVLTNPVVLATAAIGDAVISTASSALSLASSAVSGVGMMAKIISFAPIILPLGIAYGAYLFYGGPVIKGMIKSKLGVK